MAFFFVVGTHEFTSPLEGYEGVTAQCQNCGNWSAHCITRWPWFTFCWLPVLPLATHKYKEVACPICHFSQDLKNRPDVQSQHPGAHNPMPGSGYGPTPGYGPGPGPGAGPAPGQLHYK